MNRPQKTSLSVLVGTLLTGTAFGGGWTLFDEQDNSTVAVLNSCNAQGICTTPLNFNGDLSTGGQPVVDLAIGNDYGGPIRIYLGTGEDGRGFTPSFELVNSSYSFRTTGLRFADLDNDGDVEMVQTTRGSGNYVYRFRNAGAPFYCSAAPCVDAHLNDERLGGPTETDNSQGLAVGDIDLDCRIDVLVVNGVANSGDQSNKVYLNTTITPGVPAAGACPAITPNPNPIDFGPAITLPSTGVGGVDADSRKAELIDVDGDGDLDAIVANADGNDNWLYINQTRTPAPLPPPVALFADPVPLTAAAADDADMTLGLAVGDIDNDADMDIVVANGNARNRYYLNTGTGATRFSANTGTFGGASDASNDVKLADMNRDGFLDAVVTNDPGPSMVHLLQGASGALADYPIVNPTGLPGAQPFDLGSARALDLGKLDNNGWPDLIVANTNNEYNLRFLSSCGFTGCNPFENLLPSITGAAGAPLTTNEDTALSITMANVAATDGDNLPADLRLAIDPGTNYTVNTITGPAPSITPAENYSGPLTVNVRVTDLTSLSTPFALPVTVTPVPDAPTFTSTAVTTAAQGAAYSYAVTTADADTGEARTVSAPTKPAWLDLTDNGNGTATLAGTPAAADVGPHAVTLEVRDAANLVASQSFTVTVADANDAPAFTSTAVTSATAGTAYSYAIATSDPDAGDTRTITATVPAWLTLTDAGNGTATLAGTPAAGNVGPHTVSLTVRDAAGATATQDFTVTVAAAPSGGGGGTTTPPPTQPPASSGGGGGGGSTGLLEVLALLVGLGAWRRRRAA
jgi:hypothetical protein